MSRSAAGALCREGFFWPGHPWQWTDGSHGDRLMDLLWVCPFVWRMMENVFPKILGFFLAFSDKAILILSRSGLGSSSLC